MPSTKIPSILISTLQTHSSAINAVTFSSLGGTYILTGSSDRQIHLSRTEPPSSTQTKSTHSSTSTNVITTPIQKYISHGYPVLDIAVSHDNQLFASVGGDRSVFLWDVQNSSDTTIRRFGSNTSQGHTSRITCVTFCGQDDSVLISGGDDRSVRLWDVKSRDSRPLMVWEEASDGISCVLIPGREHGGGSSSEVITGSIDGKTRCYDVRTGKIMVDVMPGPVTSLSLTRDEKTLLVGCLDGKIRIMDRMDGSCLRVFPGEEDETKGYENSKLRLKSCFAVNDALVMSGSEMDGKVRVWDVLSGKQTGHINVNELDKVVSVVKWREGSVAQGRKGLWASGGVQGVTRIYSNDQ